MNKPVKKSNEFIKRRKKKIVLKRSILISILLLTTLVTLCLKLPVFNIANISVINNKNVSGETIEQLSGISIGNNIFYINNKMVKTNINSNPYISNVKVFRKFPNTIVIDVKEREATFYLTVDNKYIILDSEGVILEIRDNIEGLQLVRADGIKITNAEVGKMIGIEGERQLKILVQFAELLERNVSDVKMEVIDLSNVIDIKIYSSELCFKIGNGFDMEVKLNKAINIASIDEVKSKKGYIDVSFDGNPVLYTE